MDSATATADGKRLAFRKYALQGNVYVADLEPAGHASLPQNASRCMRAGIIRPHGQPTARRSSSDPIATVNGGSLSSPGPGSTRTYCNRDRAVRPGAAALVSPDGAWILYLAYTAPDAYSSFVRPERLMRVPITKGPAEIVRTAQPYGRPVCVSSSASLCALAELAPDRAQLIFTAFDPLKGRGSELTRFPIDKAYQYTGGYLWDLSPDGTRIAILKYSDARIHILSLGSGSSQEIAVKGWNNLQSLNWAADGKGLFAASYAGRFGPPARQSTGHAHVLWEQQGSTAPWHLLSMPRWFGAPSAPMGRAISGRPPSGDL